MSTLSEYCEEVWIKSSMKWQNQNQLFFPFWGWSESCRAFGSLSYRQILDNISPVILVNTHTERERLYLMLSSNSCQVEMALCNHGDTQYNLVCSGKQKTPSTTTSTVWYHPWAFSRMSFSLYNLLSLGPQAQWIQSNKVSINQRHHQIICLSSPRSTLAQNQISVQRFNH